MDACERMGHTLALQYGACVWRRQQLRMRGALGPPPWGPTHCSTPPRPAPAPQRRPTTIPRAGGSEAHATFFQRQRGQWEAGVLSRDLLTAVRRIYSNYVSDAEKQVGLQGGSSLLQM